MSTRDLLADHTAAIAELRQLVAQADARSGSEPEFVRTAVAAMLLILGDHAGSYEIHHGQDIDTHTEMLAEIAVLEEWLGDWIGDWVDANELYVRITT